MTEPTAHYSVLLQESIAGLAIQAEGLYIDGTFGRGGHSGEILKHLTTGQLLAIDQDPEAIAYANTHFQQPNFRIQAGSFENLEQYCDALGWTGKVQGILLDLGVSSPQLDDASRGFSFMHDGPLDMRMNSESGQSALQWLQAVEEKTLSQVLRQYGDEKYSGRIARVIKEAIAENSLHTTLELADLVRKASPKVDKHKHPATRTFQAIRIAVNRELDVLHKVLAAAVTVLASGGRLSVISFHSLEDRIVKQFMRDQSSVRDLFPDSPVQLAVSEPVLKRVGKPIFPSEEENAQNSRSRSAVLRIAEKL